MDVITFPPKTYFVGTWWYYLSKVIPPTTERMLHLLSLYIKCAIMRNTGEIQWLVVYEPQNMFSKTVIYFTHGSVTPFLESLKSFTEYEFMETCDAQCFNDTDDRSQ